MEDDRKVSANFAGAYHHDDSSDDEDDGDPLNRSKGPLRKRKYTPSPPKRFKSSYICFSMAMQDTVKAEMGGDQKIGQVSKYMAEKWRNLDDEERAKWDEVARKDRERYEAEMALFPGPKPKPKQRPKKDPTAPKRPMSAFLAFSQKYRGTVRQNDPTVHNRDVSKKLSEMWKDLPEREKKKFIEQESKEREVYKGKESPAFYGCFVYLALSKYIHLTQPHVCLRAFSSTHFRIPQPRCSNGRRNRLRYRKD